MNVKKLPYDEFKSIYSRVPRLCVDLVIQNKDGVLLTKRAIAPKKGWWHFPGGTVLMGEMLSDTVNRVAKEELNTKVEIKRLIGILEYPKGSGFGYPVSVSYLVRPRTKMGNGEQTKEMKFFKSAPQKTIAEVKRFIVENFPTPSPKSRVS